ncbi:MAG: hypothetical protein Q9P90_13995 [candidate division KSB1 bacterium]|nr:hypothetical protein [candidate division KSB1 bacterium]
MLELKPGSIWLNKRQHGLSFLGARIFPGTIRIRRENLRRSLKRYRQRLWQHHQGERDDEALERSLQSLLGHLSFFDTYGLRSQIFWGRG